MIKDYVMNDDDDDDGASFQLILLAYSVEYLLW